MLPRLFFVHFCNTSFVAEEGERIVGFLIGFLSQAQVEEAYIHFAGVHPACRRQGVGRALYERFFEAAEQEGRMIVRCVTSPVNKGSIAFHTGIGFEIEQRAGVTEEEMVWPQYDGPDNDRVLFVRRLSAQPAGSVGPTDRIAHL